jgi:hypothetical protein
METNLGVKLIHGKWWITGMPDGELNCGAYDTKAEANDDMQGMKRFFRDCDKPGFCMSVDEEREKGRKGW